MKDEGRMGRLGRLGRSRRSKGRWNTGRGRIAVFPIRYVIIVGRKWCSKTTMHVTASQSQRLHFDDNSGLLEHRESEYLL